MNPLHLQTGTGMHSMESNLRLCQHPCLQPGRMHADHGSALVHNPKPNESAAAECRRSQGHVIHARHACNVGTIKEQQSPLRPRIQPACCHLTLMGSVILQRCIQRQHQGPASVSEAAPGLPHHVQQHAWGADRAEPGL